MIPNKNSRYYNGAKFAILEEGDIIKSTDEYYNPIFDKWESVSDTFIGQEFHSDESKPVRRKIQGVE